MKDTYWFKRKRYGWGWTPVTLEGWLMVLVFLGVLIGGALTIKDVPEGEFTTEVGFYLLFVVIATVALIRLSAAHGPKPKWRWGTKPNDNPEEDW